MASKSSLKDPDLRRLRALRMIEMRIKGKTLAEVAKEFGVSKDTVERSLSWAKKAELVVQAEDKILRELVPAATAALRAVLAGENDEVKAKTALEIFKGTLPSFAKGKSNAVAPGADGGLAAYVNSLRDSSNDLALDGEVVGTVGTSLPGSPEGSPQRLITAGSTADSTSGLPDAAASAESALDAG